VAKQTIRDLDLAGKRVFIRVDFNVPIKDGRITDDTRIRASLSTITYALAKIGGGVVILASHLGRPKGKPDPQFSLKPVAERLAQLLGKPWYSRPTAGRARAAIERRRAAWRCSRTCASTPARRRTTRPSRRPWPLPPRPTSTTPSAAPTARTRRRRAWRLSCWPPPAC
jgi:hypothetical protein